MEHSKAQGITIQVVHIFNQQRVVSFLTLLAIQMKQRNRRQVEQKEML